MLLEALEAAGVSWWRRWPMWAAVRVFGGRSLADGDGGGSPLAWILPTLRFPAIASRHADRIVAWAAGNVPKLI